MTWVKWNPEGKRGGRGRNVDWDVMMSRDKDGRICVYLSKKAQDALRWQKGDTVCIQFNPDAKLIGFVRDENGNRLSESGSGGKRLRVVYKLPEELSHFCVNGSSRRLKKGEWTDENGMLVVEMVGHE